MKKIVTFSLICMLVLAVAGCTETSGARETVEQALLSLQTPETISTEIDSALKDILSENRLQLKEKLTSMLAETEYKVQGEKEQADGSVEFQVSVKTVDTSVAMERFLTNISNVVASPDYQERLQTMEAVEYHQTLVDAMLLALEEKIPDTEQNITLTVMKGEDGWVLSDDTPLHKSLLFDLAEAISSLV